MKKCIASLFLGLVIAGLSLTTARAEEKAGPKATTAAVKAGEAALTMDSLRDLLDGMGYDIDKPVKDKEGKIIGYNIKYDTGKFGANVYVLLSNDMSNLWFTISLTKVEDTGTASSKALADLLVANDQIFPVYFCLVPSNNFLYLKGYLPNKGITAKDVQKRLSQMGGALNTTDKLWDTTKWTTKS